MLSRGVCRNFCLLHSSRPDGPLPASLPPRAGLPAAHKATGSPGPSAFLERGLLPCPSSAGLGGSRSLDVSTSPAWATPTISPSPTSGLWPQAQVRGTRDDLGGGHCPLGLLFLPSALGNAWRGLWRGQRREDPASCGRTAVGPPLPRPLPAGPAAINQEINNLLPPFLKPPLPFPVESPVCLGTSQSGPPRGGPR